MILAGTGTGSRGSWRAMPPCHFTCLMRFCRSRRGLQGSVRWAGRAHHFFFFFLLRCDVGFSAFAGFAGFLLLCRGVAMDLLSSSAARGPVQSPRLCRLLRRCRRSPSPLRPSSPVALLTSSTGGGMDMPWRANQEALGVVAVARRKRSRRLAAPPESCWPLLCAPGKTRCMPRPLPYRGSVLRPSTARKAGSRRQIANRPPRRKAHRSMTASYRRLREQLQRPLTAAAGERGRRLADRLIGRRVQDQARYVPPRLKCCVVCRITSCVPRRTYQPAPSQFAATRQTLH